MTFDPYSPHLNECKAQPIAYVQVIWNNGPALMCTELLCAPPAAWSHAAAEGEGQTHCAEAAGGWLLRSLRAQVLLRERSRGLQTAPAGRSALFSRVQTGSYRIFTVTNTHLLDCRDPLHVSRNILSVVSVQLKSGVIFKLRSWKIS